MLDFVQLLFLCWPVLCACWLGSCCAILLWICSMLKSIIMFYFWTCFLDHALGISCFICRHISGAIKFYVEILNSLYLHHLHLEYTMSKPNCQLLRSSKPDKEASCKCVRITIGNLLDISEVSWLSCCCLWIMVLSSKAVNNFYALGITCFICCLCYHFIVVLDPFVQGMCAFLKRAIFDGVWLQLIIMPYLRSCCYVGRKVGIFAIFCYVYCASILLFTAGLTTRKYCYLIYLITGSSVEVICS